MFKQLSIFALFALAAAKPGFVEEHHHVIQPVVAKVGVAVHSSPSAVSHQSITQVHNKAHIVTPVVKAYAATPVVHAAPVAHFVKTVAAPVVHTYAAPAAVVKTVHSSPVVHVAAPAVLKTVHAAPVVSVVKTYGAPIVNSAISHQSHTQIHHQKSVITPIVKSYVAAPVVPVVHAAPIVKTYFH